jgi:hypothetical protein
VALGVDHAVTQAGELSDQSGAFRWNGKVNLDDSFRLLSQKGVPSY